MIMHDIACRTSGFEKKKETCEYIRKIGLISPNALPQSSGQRMQPRHPTLWLAALLWVCIAASPDAYREAVQLTLDEQDFQAVLPDPATQQYPGFNGLLYPKDSDGNVIRDCWVMLTYYGAWEDGTNRFITADMTAFSAYNPNSQAVEFDISFIAPRSTGTGFIVWETVGKTPLVKEYLCVPPP